MVIAVNSVRLDGGSIVWGHMVENDVLEALARLEMDKDWQTFLVDLNRRKEEARDQLMCTCDPWQTGRAQGRAELAAELLELAKSARDVIAKRRSR